MTYLQKIDHNPAATPASSKALPERLISGDPSYLTWALDRSREEATNGPVRTGVWEATPGETVSIKGDSFEFCQILSGMIELTEDGHAPVTFRGGDSFIMKPGFRGVWKTIETVRKIYVIVG
ncbi:cupin domain-containing protein [Paracoccus actinidiae]|uniref:cupin domain-containing protein n=1 Tax=Paracoccus actinidiae TaxID=3064531 RepID=UPI0027D344B6|nr:cupin domain-containing protein [Paracoccus sp. M09]